MLSMRDPVRKSMAGMVVVIAASSEVSWPPAHRRRARPRRVLVVDGFFSLARSPVTPGGTPPFNPPFPPLALATGSWWRPGIITRRPTRRPVPMTLPTATSVVS